MTSFPFLLCWCKRLHFQSMQSRRFEARRGRGLGRKTYWHKDKARLMGTRNFRILLLKSQQGWSWSSWCLCCRLTPSTPTIKVAQGAWPWPRWCWLVQASPVCNAPPSAPVFQCLLPVCFSPRPLENSKSGYDLQRRVKEQPFAFFTSANKLGELYLQSLCCFAPKPAGSPLRSSHQRLSIRLSSSPIHKRTSLHHLSNGRTVWASYQILVYSIPGLVSGFWQC